MFKEFFSLLISLFSSPAAWLVCGLIVGATVGVFIRYDADFKLSFKLAFIASMFISALIMWFFNTYIGDPETYDWRTMLKGFFSVTGSFFACLISLHIVKGIRNHLDI